MNINSAGRWWATMSYESRIKNSYYLEIKEKIENDWDPVFKDRKNELVMIGMFMDKTLIMKELEGCLCTDNEIVAYNEKKSKIKDPFPIIE
jgi:hypothetical protein